MKNCFLCKKEIPDSDIVINSDTRVYRVICDACGEYKMTEKLIMTLREEDKLSVVWFIKNKRSELFSTENIGMVIQDHKISKQVY